jgi:hypothetical protein
MKQINILQYVVSVIGVMLLVSCGGETQSPQDDPPPAT